MNSDTVDADTLRIDDMHVAHPRAAGLDVHKMHVTAAVRLCEAGGGPARTAVREFSALPDGLRTRPYTDPGIDYRRLLVERNAPRWLRMLGQYGFINEVQAAARP